NVSAQGVMAMLRQAEWVAGRDISVIVFGGLSVQDPALPAVSAILQPEPREAGRTLAHLMLRRLAGEPVNELCALWKPVFVPGATDIPV
ncbi:MAG: substrate-binding domain-containing protein, partial [Iodobacter sp.]